VEKWGSGRGMLLALAINALNHSGGPFARIWSGFGCARSLTSLPRRCSAPRVPK
jgi:hypothetical protein